MRGELRSADGPPSIARDMPLISRSIRPENSGCAIAKRRGGFCLREADDDSPPAAGDADVDVEKTRDRSKEPVKIVCASCGHELTNSEARATIDGAHRHVKVNPHGHVFHIACFQPAPGVCPIGTPSAEFSWFEGYRWRVALCGGCNVHVGWAFSSGDQPFSALIEGRFIEESGE